MSNVTEDRHARARLTHEGQQLVLRYLPLARALAKPMKEDWPTMRDEFESVACLALVEAAESFDPERQTRFATFARYRIVGALLDLRRTLFEHYHNAQSPKRIVRRTPPRSAHKGTGQVLGIAEPQPVGLDVERQETLESCLRQLPANHAETCRLLYLQGKTQVEAARILGYSQSRLSTMRREALEMLKAIQNAQESAA